MDLPFSNCRLGESNLRSFQALIWVTHPQSDDFLSWMPVQCSASSHLLSVPWLTLSQISPCPTWRTLMAFKARVHTTWTCGHFKYPEVFVKVSGGFQSIFIPRTPFQTLKMCCYTHMNECIPYFMTWNCTFLVLSTVVKGLPQWLSGKEPSAMQQRQIQSLGRKILWRRKWQPTPVFLPGKSNGQRSLVVYSPRVTKSQTQLRD